ncbi:MAG: hypothetical protein ACHP7P_10155 [Terriglobales bacterium]
MKTKDKTAPVAETAQVLENFVPLYMKGIEVIAELQKKSLEIAAQQNTEWVAAGKKAVVRFIPAAQVNPVFDLAAQAFDTALEGQKDAIDLMLEQNQTVAGFAKEGIESVANLTNGLTALFQKSVEYSVTMQKKALELAAEQNKSAYDTVSRQFGFSGSPVETFQRSLDALMETQKKVLDIAAKPLKTVA